MSYVLKISSLNLIAASACAQGSQMIVLKVMLAEVFVSFA
jgi:hypothetical protein